MSHTTVPFKPRAFWFWGRLMLLGGLAVGLLLVIVLTAQAPDLLPFFLAALLGLLALSVLFRRPLLNLSAVLIGFILISDNEMGFQAVEILYGLYFLAFLAYWFIRHLLLRIPITHTPEEKALLLFLIAITLTLPLTLLFGGSPRLFLSEWNAMLFLGLYFPVREACVEYPNATKRILIVLLGVALFIACRNLFNYQTILIGASQLWQVTKGRIATNDALLMIASVIALAFFLFSQRWPGRLLMLASFSIFFPALILTQSRGFWVSFLLGAFVIFLFLDRSQKKQLILFALGGSTLLFTFAIIFLDDLLFLVLGGLLDRLLTLQTAATADVSLVNRFLETGAVWDRIKANPILGYGMGVEYYVFDIPDKVTKYKSFVHNGYFSLWYRFGIWGLGLFLFFWVMTIRRGLQTFRRATAPHLLRVTGLATAASLVAYMLTTNTSNPFFLNDTTFLFGVLMGLAGGVNQRLPLYEATTSPPTAT